MHKDIADIKQKAEAATGELENCPFCGSVGGYDINEDHHGKFFWLGCSVVDCIGYNLYYTEPVENLDDAIAAWNTRVFPNATILELLQEVEAAEKERDIIREEMRTKNMASSKALDELWKDIILKHKPKYGDWEYPMQAYRHIMCEFNDLTAKVEEYEGKLEKRKACYTCPVYLEMKAEVESGN